ncbi:S-layer homology domain-containing protein [Paenibacillus chartarius]|uniref:S-layer homology domain-containing protein n=1 Tax=Paenibacillus chartarius TaxID=747481 RepID=A0ABV6DFZ5_9BACL
MAVSAFAGSASAAPAAPAFAISQVIKDLNFTNQPAKAASLYSFYLGYINPTLSFSNDPKEFTVSLDGVSSASIYLNRDYGSMNEVADHLNEQLTRLSKPIAAEVGDDGNFSLSTVAVGSSARLIVGGTNGNELFPIAESAGQDAAIKNKIFTVGDGVDTATIALTANETDMATFVSDVNSVLAGSNVNVTAEAKGRSEFTLTSEVTGQASRIDIGGANASDFFAQSSYAGHDVTQTTETVTASTNLPDTSYYAQTVYTTLILISNNPLMGDSPTGTATLTVDNGAPQTKTVSGGIADFATSGLTVGEHTFVFSYSGDANYSSTSLTKTLTTGKDRTVTQLTITPSAANEGETVTLRAEVPTIAPGDPNVTGNVAFYDGANLLGTKALETNNYFTSMTVSNLAAGDHSITAVYEGDPTHLSSTSMAKILKVVNPDVQAVANTKISLKPQYAQGEDEDTVYDNMTLPVFDPVNGVNISWESSDTSVVENNGVVRPPVFFAGEAHVTLKANLTKNGVKDTKTFNLTVQTQAQPALESVAIDQGDFPVTVGQTYSLTATGHYEGQLTNPIAPSAVSWSSSDTNVAAVDANGVLTVLAAGHTKISASYDGIASPPIEVTATQAPTALTASNNPVTITAGTRTPSVITATYSDHSTAVIDSVYINWTSDNTAVATVGVEVVAGIHTAVISGVAAGSTVINAVYGGQTLHIPVTVVAPDDDSSSGGLGGGSSGGSSSTTISSAPTQTEPKSGANPEPDIFQSSVVKTDTNVVHSVETLINAAKNTASTIAPSDTKGHWAEKTVDTFVKLGVIKGYEDGTAKPNQEITRAEFVSILSRIFTVSGTKQVQLNDVGSHWAHDAIEQFASAGVIGGYGDGTFQPDRTISREEMVLILSRIVNMNNVAKDATKGNFADLHDSYASDAIQQAAQAGIISGKDDGNFDPKADSTRAEALTIILNVLNLNTQIKTLLDSLK